MTDKEKVLKVYPEAFCGRGTISGICSVMSKLRGKELGWAMRSEEAAWQNAAQSLPAQPEQEIIEGAELSETEKQRSESAHKYLDDAWIREMAEKEDGCLVSAGGLIADIESVESLPVEAKEVVYDAWGKAGRLVPKPTLSTPAEHTRADCEGCNKPDCPCNSLEEAMKLHGEDEIVGCYLGELMSHFGDIDDAWDKKDVEFQEDLLRRLFRDAIADSKTQPDSSSIPEQTFEEWWKQHSNGLLPKGSVIEYNARAAWNAAKGQR